MRIIPCFIFAEFILHYQYLAGAINKFREDLHNFRVVEKVYEDHALLISGLKHDLEHPLSNIACFLEDIKRNNYIDPEGLLSCDQSFKIIGETLDDIVSFHSVKRERRNLKNILDIVISALKYSLKQAKVTSDVVHDDSCPDIIAPPGIFRAFQNLIQNALDNLSKKESKDKKIQIKSQYDKEGNCIRIHVIDNGTGIPPNIKEDIFEPHMSITGKGLGLPISKNIFNVMGGDLTILDTGQNGTTFEVLLKV